MTWCQQRRGRPGPAKINIGAGMRWIRYRAYTAMLKISNLANTKIQNHVFGDIIKRQITGEFRLRLPK